ncbi:MAG: 16S rRNA (cytosine(1402)-N(4))-methyltransferase RsmH [Verrucomicrobiales bacterium]
MKPQGQDPSEESFYHESVMLEEAMHYLQPTRCKRFLDATVGGGGHSEKILESGAELIGLDQDPDAIEFARERLEGYGQACSLIEANYAEFPEILSTVGVGRLDGILMDLGISTRQLDNAQRGFSFMKPGPLDMRMNPGGELTAEYLVNHSEEQELQRIFHEYGEEPAGRRIAAAIVRARVDRPITTTTELAETVERVCARRGRKRHPATRVFQALRIAVNDELHSLESGLQSSISWLKPGGRLAVISFHSLEDRIVKRFMRRHSRVWIDRPEWPEPKPNPDYHFDLVFKKGLRPSRQEVSANPRARSAILRVVERVNYA